MAGGVLPPDPGTAAAPAPRLRGGRRRAVRPAQGAAQPPTAPAGWYASRTRRRPYPLLGTPVRRGCAGSPAADTLCCPHHHGGEVVTAVGPGIGRGQNCGALRGVAVPAGRRNEEFPDPPCHRHRTAGSASWRRRQPGTRRRCRTSRQPMGTAAAALRFLRMARPPLTLAAGGPPA